jgi:alpha-beta hydrolase superfamily lysophospholipase
MPHQEFSLTTKNNLELYAQAWEPQTPPKAAVCLIHGLGEHSGRYQHVAEAFNQAGFAMLSFDHRGHGKSPGKRGHIPDYETLLDDIDNALETIRERYPGLPIFLYGHSMGGSLVLNYALRRQPQLTGVICTSPWIKVSHEPPKTQVLVARLMNKIAPSFTQGNELDARGLSRDPQVVHDYQDDPLVHDQASARLFVEFYEAGYWALAHAKDLSLPLLLAHGSLDPITSAAASQEFSVKAGKLCTLKIWDGMLHETHNEIEREKVIAYYIQWAENQLSD